MQDNQDPLYRSLKRPMIIYDMDSYKVLMVGEYERLTRLLKEFEENARRYNLVKQPKNISGLELNCSQSEFDRIVMRPGYLQNYINNNLENFLNSIMKK